MSCKVGDAVAGRKKGGRCRVGGKYEFLRHRISRVVSIDSVQNLAYDSMLDGPRSRI